MKIRGHISKFLKKKYPIDQVIICVQGVVLGRRVLDYQALNLVIEYIDASNKNKKSKKKKKRERNLF